MKIDKQFITDILQGMVQIDSTNPSLHPSGAGEAAIADYCAGHMRNLGLAVSTYEAEPGRVSVVGTQKGSGEGKSLLLNAHLDTVDVEGMAEPFSGRIEDGKLFGRGSQDMKGAMAAQIGAFKALADAGISLKGDLHIAGVADEEFASIGVQSILPHYQPDSVIVTEPSDLQISLAHKGFIWIEVKTYGRAYHGSRPDLGVDANMRMGRFLARLDQLEQELAKRPPHHLLGPPSLHAATISGGTAWSAYSAACTLGVERRTIPGETVEQVETEIQALIDEMVAADSTLKIDMKIELVRDWFEVDESAPIVQCLKQAASEILGQPSQIIGQHFWTDAAYHSQTGSDTVLIGPVGHGLHSVEEWVDLNSVFQLAELLALTIKNYCEESG
ncbi:MAG: ArgE/DapE family deacylase [Chloroflexota bacterium]